MGKTIIQADIYQPGDSIRRTASDPVSGSLTGPIHPLNVKPSGNAYLAERNLKSACGLFGVLPDEVLVQVLGFLDAPALNYLGSTCKARE